MLKLVKYEFRKTRTQMLVLLAATAVLQCWFLGAMHMKSDDNVLISSLLLYTCGIAVAIFAFVRGVTAYSGELKSRSAYLIFMTPNSMLSIVASKMLYTFFNGLLFAAIYGALAFLDVRLLMEYLGELESVMEMVKESMLEYGVNVDQILMALLGGLGTFFLSVMSTIAIAYDAITISRTLFRDKKWRWLPSLAIFALLTTAVEKITEQLPVIHDVAVTASEMVVNLLPTMGLSAAVIAVSIFACAAMLKYRVSL